MRKYGFLSVLLLICIQVFCQSSANTPSDAPVEKQYNKGLLQFNPRIDLLLKDNRTSIYLGSVMNYKYAYTSLIENYKWNMKLGIDYAAAEKWYVGVSGRVNAYDSKTYNICTRLYLQHRGNIGSVLFSQEVLYEQFNFANNTMSTTSASGTVTSRRPAEGRIGIGIGLGKYIKAGNNHIGVFASYRPYIQFDFKNDNASYYKDRFIDYTNLRIDAGYLIANQLYIGVYGERDTNFSYVTSADPYRLNSVTPIIGLACNYLIFAGADKEKLGTKAFKYFYTK